MKRIPLTAEGEQKLKNELYELKTKSRPEVINAIAEARAHGDLKENAEYHAAREHQGFIEARIKELETKLANAQVIDVTKLTNHGKVVFGSTVELLNLNTDEEVVYQIVGDDESDVKNHKISVSSPIARSLIGKMEGDEVTVNTPEDVIVYEISEVRYL